VFYRNEIRDDARPPGRAHYPWYELEEFHPDGGMWSIPPAADRARLARAAEVLMAHPDRFREAMRRACREWPKSTEAALTNPSLNHRAWLGHAGCWLATGSPEETTREGWRLLDPDEQAAADDAAEQVIDWWRHRGAQPNLFDLLPSLGPFGDDDA
jgi:hypothetical protein